jgi:hypothetical protein
LKETTLEQSEINAALSILQSIRRTTYYLKDLYSKLEYYPAIKDKEHLIELIWELYRFGAIGNVFHDEENRHTHFTWVHLDEDSEPDFTAKFTIHSGLRAELKDEAI